jgi:arabinogalactan endo-1,4-beta-galactosidase
MADIFYVKPIMKDESREHDVERRLVFIDLIKALRRIKCWECFRMENIQYHIKSNTKAGLTQMLSEILGKVTKLIQLTEGTDDTCVWHSGNIYQIGRS